MMNFKFQTGFTLVELLVVIAIVGVVLGIGLSTLAATFRTSTKTTVFNTVKESGDLAVETIARSVRNAVDVCTRDGPDEILIYNTKVNNCASPPINAKITRFRCIEGDPTGASLDAKNGKIEKSQEEGGSFTLSPTAITSNVKVQAGSCRFEASTTTPKRVIIGFTLVQSDDLPLSPEYQVVIPYVTEVTLRNF